MRSFILSVVLAAAALGIVAVTPGEAQGAWWRRYRAAYPAYPSYYYPGYAGSYSPSMAYYPPYAAYYAPNYYWSGRYYATPYYGAGYYSRYNPWTNTFTYRYGYYR